VVYADDVLSGKNINTTKEKIKTPLDVSKEVGPEVNGEKTMFLPHQ
jgi:hypothetical protein